MAQLRCQVQEIRKESAALVVLQVTEEIKDKVTSELSGVNYAQTWLTDNTISKANDSGL